jgi:hypothetical protein
MARRVKCQILIEGKWGKLRMRKKAVTEQLPRLFERGQVVVAQGTERQRLIERLEQA